MISLKEGVSILGLKPEIIFAQQLIHHLYNRIDRECVITSGTESKHSSKSKHYLGLALDFRIRNLHSGEDFEITEQDFSIASDIVATAKSKLGPSFTVILESTHIHIEFNGFPTEKI